MNEKKPVVSEERDVEDAIVVVDVVVADDSPVTNVVVISTYGSSLPSLFQTASVK